MHNSLEFALNSALLAQKTGYTMRIIPLVSHEQMLRRGLRVAKVHLGNLKYKAKIGQFKDNFGLHPKHAASVLKDLLVFGYVDPDEADLIGFFAALSFLRSYQREKKRRNTFEMNEKPLRELTWTWVKNLAKLKAIKIVWPADEEWGDDTFIVSVDGTHRRTNEPRHLRFRRNGINYSHKSNSAGVNHEIAIDLWSQRVVHANRFDPAGRPDKSIFKEELMHKIPEGCRVVCDNGYEGLPHIYSAYNQFDTERSKEFKKRAKSRHERFNGMLKTWLAFDDRLRHGTANEDAIFEAVVTMCQYQIEDTDPESAMPIFDI